MNLADAHAIKNEVDGYGDTVRAIIAFVHQLRWDANRKAIREDVAHAHGAPHARTDAAADPVTPDVSMRVGHEFHTLGDVKMSFATDERGRRKIEEQLAKYDDALSVIASNPFPPAEVGSVLLTHYSRKTEAADYFAGSTTWAPKNPFAVIAFARVEQSEQWITLERAHGTLVPAAQDEAFRKIVKIATRHLTRYAGIQFYDAAPHQAHVLCVVWDLVLPLLRSEDEFARTNAAIGIDERAAPADAMQDDRDDQPAGTDQEPALKPEPPAPRRGTILIDAEVADVTARLQESYSLRSLNPSLPGSPSTKCVRAAFERLVALDLAERTETEDVFRVSYRRLSPGTLEWFAKKLAPKAKKATKPAEPDGQLSLFGRGKSPPLSAK